MQMKHRSNAAAEKPPHPPRKNSLPFEPLPFEAYRRYLSTFVRKVLARCHSAGLHSITADDVMSEISVAYCMAYNNWKPEHNVPFAPYFMRGAQFHVNRWLKYELREIEIAPFSMNNSTATEQHGDFYELIASPEQSAEAIVQERQSIERAMKRLSPRAAKAIEILHSPPPEVVEVLLALQERASFARSRGYHQRSQPDITLTLIFNLMGLSVMERRNVYKELEDYARWTIQRNA